MSYQVLMRKRVIKQAEALPENIRARFQALVYDLRQTGPHQPSWPNYSKLTDGYHCHLTHHWVACWRYDKGTITIEVYYVGSRQNAPYGS